MRLSFRPGRQAPAVSLQPYPVLQPLQIHLSPGCPPLPVVATVAPWAKRREPWCWIRRVMIQMGRRQENPVQLACSVTPPLAALPDSTELAAPARSGLALAGQLGPVRRVALRLIHAPPPYGEPEPALASRPHGQRSRCSSIQAGSARQGAGAASTTRTAQLAISSPVFALRLALRYN